MGSSTAFMLVEKNFKARNKILLEFYILTYTNEPTIKSKKKHLLLYRKTNIMGSRTAFMLAEMKVEARNKIRLVFYIRN